MTETAIVGPSVDEWETCVNIERKRKWQLGAAIAVMVGGTTWLAAVPGPGTGHSFTPTSLASPFTQDLYATTGNVQPGGVLGGVAFAPDGRVWSAECNFLGTRLHLHAVGPRSGHACLPGLRAADACRIHVDRRALLRSVRQFPVCGASAGGL
jgi:hypothetical protein